MTRHTKYRGLIKFWNQVRLFGFIQYTDPDGKEQDVFVHRINFMTGDTPSLGAVVEFEIGPPQSLGKRDQAVKVKVIEVAAGINALAKRQGGV
jgi:cold shock CspA family protein